MKIPMRWLNEYASVDIMPEQYAEKMIMSGTGVEGYEVTGESFSGVYVGKITEIRDHENSDHLKICMVDVGDEILQIVTGAPNAAAGQYVAVARAGAVLPGGEIKSGELRGVLSQGMLCSGPELEIPEGLYPHCGDAGILVFQEEQPLGADVKSVFGLGDTVVDFEILANRPDCLSVWGIARETAAALDVHCVMPEIAVETVGGGTISDYARVDVRDDLLCPRYCARVIRNVRIGRSPEWMREYLYGAGVRPINNIVDITNFVMLETGHPMHAFDLSKVRDRAIVVRRAFDGEALTTLDGKAHVLTPDMLVIADNERATGLAGIMGGEESEITGDTAEVLFECAAFDRTNTRLTARALGIRTESSGRFERGVCPATALEAIERACMLVNMLSCGDVVPGVIDHYPNPAEERTVTASVQYIAARIGVQISGEVMQDILERLFFDVTLDGDLLICRVPRYRSDVETAADISEEVLRLYGYDAIPSTLMRGETMAGGRSDNEKRNDRIRAAMVGLGFYEAMNYSFVSRRSIEQILLPCGDARLDPVVIANPLGEDTGVMRTTLLPSMLNTLSVNRNHGIPSAKLFELAPVFVKRDGALPDERLTLCAGMYGDGCDFYALRDAVVPLMSGFGIDAALTQGGGAYFHPGRKAAISADGVMICELGEIHPDVAESFGLSGRVYVALIDVGALAAAATEMAEITPLPKYPAVARDLAFVMDELTPIGPYMRDMKRAAGSILESVEVFDMYRGAQLGEGKKSVAFALRFRSPDGTLTDEVVSASIDKILKLCDDVYGAGLRK